MGAPSNQEESTEGIEAEEEEAKQAKMARDPAEPTPVERAAHAATHLPYRSWCEWCVKCRLDNPSHTRIGAEELSVPEIGLDYAFIRKEEETATLTILLM